MSPATLYCSKCKMLDIARISLLKIQIIIPMSTRSIIYSLCTWCFLVASCTTGGARVFRVEPQNQITFGAYHNLKAGQVIHITIFNRTKNEVFLANECGEGCLTSKLSLYHEFKDGLNEDFLFTVPKDGEYYFWIKEILPDGTEGPNKIVEFHCVGSRFSAKFRTGTLINGELAPPVAHKRL